MRAGWICVNAMGHKRFLSHALVPMSPSMSALLIMGPTASGKSALALALAERLGGEIVNADSMQVYRDLRVLTARPTPEEEARAPHHLYGHVDAGELYSTGAGSRTRSPRSRRSARAGVRRSWSAAPDSTSKR